MKIAICGIGRIGRCLTRLIINRNNDYHLSHFFDIENDINNICYLLNHDTTYGWLSEKFSCEKENILYKGTKIKYIESNDYTNTNWQELEFDILIDASGVNRDWIKIKKLCYEFSRLVIVTHHPKDFCGQFVVEGLKQLSSESRLISTSICDVVGIAPVLSAINDFKKIKTSSIVSLHPWLSYQNLVDGSVRSISNPGHSWKDYALGRASTESIIPKETTIASSLKDLLPNDMKISAMSFRTPTSIVTSAILHIYFYEEIDFEIVDIIKIFQEEEFKKFISINNESLVSIDFRTKEQASIIDQRFTEIIEGNTLRMIVWYDNEWGYSSSIMRRINNLHLKK